MKHLACYILFFIIILTAYAAKNKKLKPNTVGVSTLKKPEKFTKTQWKNVLKQATNFKLDYNPTGSQKLPSSAGKAKEQDKGFSIISSHIVGGTTATRGQFPWQAGLTLDGSFFCGGSLIHQRWILTAAHCTKSTYKFNIILGAQNRFVAEDGREAYISTEKYTHPAYIASTVTNDVALVKLPNEAPINQYINLIRLPKTTEASNSFEGVIATSSGWGLTVDGGTVSTILQYLEVPVISNEQCLKVFGRKYIYSSTLCTSGVNKKGTCNGDSGGPLVYKEISDGQWTQIGVVSFGSVSCQDSNPSAYARVTSFLGWISNVTGIYVRKT